MRTTIKINGRDIQIGLRKLANQDSLVGHVNYTRMSVWEHEPNVRGKQYFARVELQYFDGMAYGATIESALEKAFTDLEETIDSEVRAYQRKVESLNAIARKAKLLSPLGHH